MTLRNSCLWASQKELTSGVTEYLLIVLMYFTILEDFPIKPSIYGPPLNANLE
jgi:hypothetical protein